MKLDCIIIAEPERTAEHPNDVCNNTMRLSTFSCNQCSESLIGCRMAVGTKSKWQSGHSANRFPKQSGKAGTQLVDFLHGSMASTAVESARAPTSGALPSAWPLRHLLNPTIHIKQPLLHVVQLHGESVQPSFDGCQCFRDATQGSDDILKQLQRVRHVNRARLVMGTESTLS